MDINNFGPFNSEVWGTFSDWVMISVTSITAYYLYRTLQSQKNLNALQKKVTDIESYKHRVSIMPKFTVNFNRSSLVNTQTSVSGNFSIRLVNNHNMAVNNSFKVIVKHNNLFEPSFPNPYLNPKIQPKEPILLTSKISIQTYDKGDQLNKFWYPLDLEIEFSDVDNNRYIQNIICIFTDRTEEDWIIYKEPELLSI